MNDCASSLLLQHAPLDTAIVVHTLPGRLRLHIPRLAQLGAERIEEQVRGLPGIESARANALTGNVLVEYDPQRLTAADVRAALAALAALDSTNVSAHLPRTSPLTQTRNTVPSPATRPGTPPRVAAERVGLVLKGASLALSLSSLAGNPLALAVTGVEALQLLAEARAHVAVTAPHASHVCGACGSALPQR